MNLSIFRIKKSQFLVHIVDYVINKNKQINKLQFGIYCLQLGYHIID